MVKELKCQRCGYCWEYKGKMFQATCPKCFIKVKVSKVEIKEDTYNIFEV